MEKDFRELIEAEGQTDGLYLAIYPKRDCRFIYFNIINGKKVPEYIDVLMAILDNNEEVELLCSSPDDTRREFVYFSSLPRKIQCHIFNCFKK